MSAPPAAAEGAPSANPVVFFDVSIGEMAAGRIKMELFADRVPRTAENFRQFCTGEFRPHGTPVGYKNAAFHRIVKDFMVQGGDFVNGDGTGNQSIYGPSFEDEALTSKHDAPGLLSMANRGPNTNGCQFYILTADEASWLDGKHVVFGKVLDTESMLAVRRIEAVTTHGAQNRPTIPVTITECGEM